MIFQIYIIYFEMNISEYLIFEKINYFFIFCLLLASFNITRETKQ